mmetsp:Transcript_4498/g.14584  ORF Transcript_4498/g.14584 Transcript_4498/m.14584 type:complete len:272 (-) Transcript_4498:1117-1932(-)
MPRSGPHQAKRSLGLRVRAVKAARNSLADDTSLVSTHDRTTCVCVPRSLDRSDDSYTLTRRRYPRSLARVPKDFDEVKRSVVVALSMCSRTSVADAMARRRETRTSSSVTTREPASTKSPVSGSSNSATSSLPGDSLSTPPGPTAPSTDSVQTACSGDASTSTVPPTVSSRPAMTVCSSGDIIAAGVAVVDVLSVSIASSAAFLSSSALVTSALACSATYSAPSMLHLTSAMFAAASPDALSRCSAAIFTASRKQVTAAAKSSCAKRRHPL